MTELAMNKVHTVEVDGVEYKLILSGKAFFFYEEITNGDDLFVDLGIFQEKQAKFAATKTKNIIRALLAKHHPEITNDEVEELYLDLMPTALLALSTGIPPVLEKMGLSPKKNI